MLHYAFSRKLPVQLVISSGKERVISEKTMSAHFDAVVNTGFSPVIHSADFADFDAFFEHVCSTWLLLWKQAFTDNPTGARPADMSSRGLWERGVNSGIGRRSSAVGWSCGVCDRPL